MSPAFSSSLPLPSCSARRSRSHLLVPAPVLGPPFSAPRLPDALQAPAGSRRYFWLRGPGGCPGSRRARTPCRPRRTPRRRADGAALAALRPAVGAGGGALLPGGGGRAGAGPHGGSGIRHATALRRLALAALATTRHRPGWAAGRRRSSAGGRRCPRAGGGVGHVLARQRLVERQLAVTRLGVLHPVPRLAVRVVVEPHAPAVLLGVDLVLLLVERVAVLEAHLALVDRLEARPAAGAPPTPPRPRPARRRGPAPDAQRAGREGVTAEVSDAAARRATAWTEGLRVTTSDLMFTGLVAATGVLAERTLAARPRRAPGHPRPARGEPLALGESITVDGACLSVRALPDGFALDATAETLARTTLGELPSARA